MKSEFKIEIEDQNLLKDLFKKSYSNGRLVGNTNFIKIDSNKHKDVFNMILPLNNAIIRVYNENIIDGFCRFIVDSKDGVKIYPISTYYLHENKKFLFY